MVKPTAHRRVATERVILAATTDRGGEAFSHVGFATGDRSPLAYSGVMKSTRNRASFAAGEIHCSTSHRAVAPHDGVGVTPDYSADARVVMINPNDKVVRPITEWGGAGGNFV